MISPNILILASIMILAGILGGIVNFILERRDNPEKSNWVRSVLAGIVASLLVPLFLNMISSDLIAQTAEKNDRYFVFLGFCLVAAASSSAFIRTLSDRILKEASDAKRIAEETREEVQPIVARETELESSEAPSVQAEPRLKMTSDETRVLEAFIGSKYAWRSLGGISKDTGIEKSEVTKILDSLVDKGALNYKERPGRKRWSLSVFGSLAFMESPH